MCCYSGKISLPPLEHPPCKLYNLLISPVNQARPFSFMVLEALGRHSYTTPSATFKSSDCGCLHPVLYPVEENHCASSVPKYAAQQLNATLEPERKFPEWQLKVGQGKQHTDENGNPSLPDHMKCQENTVDSLIDTIYPGITTVNHSPDYFSECTVLSGLNVGVDSLNKSLFLQSFLGRLGCFTVLTSFLPLSKMEKRTLC